MAGKHGLTDAEWQDLLYVPFAVFFAVAYADGKVRPAESNTFGMVAKKVATAAPRPQDTITRDVMSEVSRDFGSIGRSLDTRLGTGVGLDTVMTRGRDILDTKVDTTQAKVFKNTMLVLAKRVAEAGQIFRPRITPAEHQAMEAIRQHLGVASAGDSFVPFSG